MSTRVQKGSAVFRPVSKPRTRLSSSSVPPSTPAPEALHSIIPTDANASISRVTLPSITSPPPPLFAHASYHTPGETLPPTGAATATPAPESTAPAKGHNSSIEGSGISRRVRKSHAPSVLQSTTEEIDPTITTMAALCTDTGIGRVSSRAAEIQSNHAAWRASNREKRAHMKHLMEFKKYGREHEQDVHNDKPTAKEGPIAGPSTVPIIPPASAGRERSPIAANGDGFDYSQDLATSRYNVQVRIGPNGETIIDEDSLFVDRNEEESTENYTHVEESDTTKFVNSGTYGKKFRGSRWSADETERFFSALAQFGENYELISYVLPGRDRKSCKNKFKAEDKKNPGRITYCLNNRIPYDIRTLARMTGKDFSGPVPEIHARTPLTLAEPPDPNEPVPHMNTQNTTNPPGDRDDNEVENTEGVRM